MNRFAHVPRQHPDRGSAFADSYHPAPRPPFTPDRLVRVPDWWFEELQEMEKKPSLFKRLRRGLGL